eukprot:2850213-Rhodomonas_salina.1
MHHFQTAAGLNVSIGDTPLASFPNFEWGFVPADGYRWGPPPIPRDRGFVSLDAITGRTINLQRVTSELSALEGWVGVAARPTQLHHELRAWLTSAAKRYSKERFEDPILQEKRWWATASTSLARARRHLEIWCSCPDAWCKTVMRSITTLRERCSEPYPWAVHDGGQGYWQGTEAGLLGAYDTNADLVATDGSVKSSMEAGVARFSKGVHVEDWCAQVDGGDQQPSSHRPEAAALERGVDMAPLDRNVFMLVDNQSTLVTTACWVGAGSQLRQLHIANRAIMLWFINKLKRRTGWTKLAKIKSHRAEPANTIADHVADAGTTSDQIVGYSAIPVILFRAKGGLKGTWSKQLDRHAHDSAADFLQHIENPNVTEEWLARDGLH